MHGCMQGVQSMTGSQETCVVHCALCHACPQVDVFSWGVVLWEIWTLGEQPYPNLSLQEIFAGVPQCPSSAATLCARARDIMLQTRLTWALLAQTPWGRLHYITSCMQGMPMHMGNKLIPDPCKLVLSSEVDGLHMHAKDCVKTPRQICAECCSLAVGVCVLPHGGRVTMAYMQAS